MFRCSYYMHRTVALMTILNIRHITIPGIKCCPSFVEESRSQTCSSICKSEAINRKPSMIGSHQSEAIAQNESLARKNTLYIVFSLLWGVRFDHLFAFFDSGGDLIIISNTNLQVRTFEPRWNTTKHKLPSGVRRWMPRWRTKPTVSVNLFAVPR